jgi:choline dehydrogenase-like flavoprotein
MAQNYDFIIIGSGSAGSALAYRLSEPGKHTILVLEYGGTDIGPLIQMPSALSYPMNMTRYDWGFVSEPEPALGGRRLVTPRGKVIGGSSSINGMVYVRGHAKDFDTWEEMGARGWGYRTYCPISSVRKRATAAKRAGVEQRVPSTSPEARSPTRFTEPSSKLVARRVIPSPQITTAPSKRVSGPWR